MYSLGGKKTIVFLSYSPVCLLIAVLLNSLLKRGPWTCGQVTHLPCTSVSSLPHPFLCTQVWWLGPSSAHPHMAIFCVIESLNPTSRWGTSLASSAHKLLWVLVAGRLQVPAWNSLCSPDLLTSSCLCVSFDSSWCGVSVMVYVCGGQAKGVNKGLFG